MASALGAGAADYSWLAEPLTANWLGDANWSSGVWSAGTGDTATFGASSETTVNVNGDVALDGLAVAGADYAFTNGSLTVNGAVDVGAGATATIASRLVQDAADASKRLQKTGDGTLVIAAPEGVTNEIRRLRLAGGTLHIAGGEHVISGTAGSKASESEILVSLAKGRLLIDGGAHVVFTNTTSFMSNSGVDMVVSNATFDVLKVDEFLNGFSDNNVLGQTTSTITIETNGVFVAHRLRLGKSTRGGDYGVLNLRRGGTLKASALSMDSPSADYRGTVNFDGGVWVVTTNGWNSGNSRVGTTSTDPTTNWKNVSLNVCEGGLHIKNPPTVAWFRGPFRSAAEHDGGAHISGTTVAYWWGDNTYNGGTWLEGGGVIFAVQDSDRCLGRVPDVPTDNVFFMKDHCFHFGTTLSTHKNRNFWIQTNVTASVGTQNGNTGRIRGTITSAGTNGVLYVSPSWTGWTDLEPADNRTNRLNKLRVDGRLRISSGTTLVTQETKADIDAKCALYVYGNTKSFDDSKGNLTITGGVLKVTKNVYAIAKGYGQLNVLGGLFDATATKEWINGLSGVARTTVAGSGELRAATVRISQCEARDATTGLPLCSVNVNTGGVLRLSSFYIDSNFPASRGCVNLNGGTVIPRDSRVDFLGTDNGKWTNVLVRACEGGAIFDTTNFNVSVKNAVFSGAPQDGGLTKKGAGTLTLVNTNSYNGATTCAGGTLVFAHANGYPGGDLVFPSTTLAAKDKTSPLVTMQSLAFRDGCTVKISDADNATACEAMRGVKTIATLTTPLAVVPACVCTDANGAPIGKQVWKLTLADGGRTLCASYSRATVLVLR